MELELEKVTLPSDNERPFVIAGPCSAETEEQVMTTARELAERGCHNFRAGVWKPRTKPGGFEGNGEVALPWLQQVKKETGMLVSTEVATPEHVELALKYGIDILWVGARTSANPFAMQALADSLKGVDVPVFVKNPVNPDLELWIGALEGWGEEVRCHTPRILKLRQEDIPQHSYVADSYRIAPTHTRPTHHLRPVAYRRPTRTHRTSLPTSHGPRLRRTYR